METTNLKAANGQTNPGQGHGNGHGHGHEQPNKKVTIEVDSNKVKVKAGEYTVSEFKELIGVPPEKELDIVIKGEITPLEDGALIKIRGGEEFISHARCGGSS